jgi:hypothetical protein
MVHSWLWLPLHEGAGTTLHDRAGELAFNGAGRTTPILRGAAASLAGTPVGQEWSFDRSGLTLQGGFTLPVDANPDLVGLFDLPSLAATGGALVIAFNFRQVADPPPNQWLLDAIGARGGLGIVVGVGRRVAFAYQRQPMASPVWLALTPQSGIGRLNDGRAHALAMVVDLSVDPGTVTIHVDGTAIANSEASPVRLVHAELPALDPAMRITLFGRNAGGRYFNLGGGENRPYATLSNLVAVRCARRPPYGNLARFTLEQAMFRQDISMALS